MEVHAHELHKAPGHGWKHYFFEFFMLFLAVLLGFFTENMREHYMESKREKEYVHSLLQDLKEDTSFLNAAIKIHQQSNDMIDTLIGLLKSNNRSTDVQHIYLLARTIPFEDQSILIHSKTFEQLKNSGTLRLIQDQSLLDSIAAYYEQYKWIKEGPSVMQIDNRQELFLSLDKLFDMKIFQEMLQSPNPFAPLLPSTKPVLLSNDEQVINYICARYHFMYGTKKVILNATEILNNQAARLIVLLKKKYHLE